MSVLYFAYGSNMSLAQMHKRCPEHQRIGIAMLPDHALCFPRWSPMRQCGVAGIEERPGCAVWGVVYRLSNSDLAELDRSEGCEPSRSPGQNRYNRRNVTVLRDGDAERPLACLTYEARPEPGTHVPSAAYLAIIVEGAAENGLPADYVAQLHKLPCTAS